MQLIRAKSKHHSILQRDRKPQKRQSSKCSRAQNRGKQNHQTLIAWRANTGQALKSLRINILGLKQDVFARLVDVSRKHSQT